MSNMIGRINNSISHPIQSQSMHRASKVALAGIIALFAYLIANQPNPEIGNFLGRHQVAVIPVMTGIGVLALTYIFCVKPSQPSLPSLPRTSPPARRIEENGVSTTQQISEQLARYQTLKTEFDRQYANYLQNQTTIQSFDIEKAKIREYLEKMAVSYPHIDRRRWNPSSLVIDPVTPFPIVNSDAPSLSDLVTANGNGVQLIQDLSEKVRRQQEIIDQMGVLRTRLAELPARRLTEEEIQAALPVMSTDIHDSWPVMNNYICDLLVRLCARQKRSSLTTEEESSLRALINNSLGIPELEAVSAVMRPLAVTGRREIPMNPQILRQLIFMAYNNQQFDVARNLLNQLDNPNISLDMRFHHEVAIQILTNELIPTFIECLEAPDLKGQVVFGVKLAHIALSMLVRCNHPVYQRARFLADEMSYNQSRLDPRTQRAFLIHHPEQDALRGEIARLCVSDPSAVEVDVTNGVSRLPYEFRLLNLQIDLPEIRLPIFNTLIFGGSATLLQHIQNIGWGKIGMAKAGAMLKLKPSKAQAMLLNTFYEILAPSKVSFRTQTLESLKVALRAHIIEPYNLLRNLPFLPNVYFTHLTRALNAIGR